MPTLAVVRLGGGPEGSIADGFSYVQSLSVLLTTESLLLAVLGLAVTLGTPNPAIIRGTLVPPFFVGVSATILIFIVGIGAAFAWVAIFLAPFPRTPSTVVIAVCIAIVIVAEPLFAALLASGLRTKT